jgi:hypothetical protein
LLHGGSGGAPGTGIEELCRGTGCAAVFDPLIPAWMLSGWPPGFLAESSHVTWDPFRSITARMDAESFDQAYD